MGAPPVVVRRVLGQDALQMPLAEDEHPVGDFGPVSELPCGMVECQCGPVGVYSLGPVAREIAVEVVGDLDGGFVADGPECTDDVPVAGQVEGSG
jgi:hypothetical protein